MSTVPYLFAQAGVNAEALQMPKVEYFLILPELILTGGALLLLLVSSLFRERADHSVYAFYTAVVSIATLLSTWFIWREIEDTGPRSVIGGALVRDHFSLFFIVLIAVSLLLSSLIASDWLRRHRIYGPEFFVLAMLSSAGGVIMASGNDLIVVFLGLEILSIALYVLAAFNLRREQSREAGLKYFVLGSFSSAVFLYGCALVYGATGTTSLSGISNFLAQNLLIDDGLLLAGTALLIVGLGFKVAAAPFHQWTPDVYDGSPSPSVAFMAAAAKAAGFAALIRILASTLYTLQLDWKPIILVLAIVTLLVGSIIACVQRNVKRMMAYSSINHAGYILLGLYVVGVDGVSAALFYLLAYTFMVIGAFAIISVVAGDKDANHDLDTYKGLAQRRPALALAFAVLLLAQAGVPLTSGFLAKFYVIRALAENGSYAIALFAMLVAAIAAFFYLRIVIAMFGSGPDADAGTPASASGEELEPVLAGGPVPEGQGSVALATAPVSATTTDTRDGYLPAATWLALAVALVVTIVLGVAPQSLVDAIDLATRSAEDLF